MGNRYADDIKRIVGIDPNESFLDAPLVKSAIPGKRGIGYVDPVTGGGTSTSGTPGTTKLQSSLGGGSTATGSNTSGETGIDPVDPQTGVITTSTGVFSATSVIDGTSDATKTSTPQVGPAGLEYSNDGAVSAITAEDCATGDAIQIRTRNDFPPPGAVTDENGVIISNAWEDSETPGELVGFELGRFYQGIGGANIVTNDTLEGLIASARQYLNEITFAGTNNTAGAVKSIEYGGTGDVNQIVYQANSGDPLFIDFDAGFLVTVNSCPSLPTGSAQYDLSTCPLTVPPNPATEWPEDSQYDLKLEDGQFVTSPYDSEVPPEYKNPVSAVPFCFDGGRTGQTEVTKDGGFMIYETSGGAPIGIIRVYDSGGRMVAATDGTGSILDQYRP